MSAIEARRFLVLALYRRLLREGSKFPSYNFREYAHRRTRDAFRENKNATDEEAIRALIESGVESLDIIRRQVIVGTLYKADKLIIEK